MRRWSDLLCAFPSAATAGTENATINAKARRSLLMMVSFYDVNFHAWIIKGDSMEACFIPITARLRDHFPVLAEIKLHQWAAALEFFCIPT